MIDICGDDGIFFYIFTTLKNMIMFNSFVLLPFQIAGTQKNITSQVCDS